MKNGRKAMPRECAHFCGFHFCSFYCCYLSCMCGCLLLFIYFLCLIVELLLQTCAAVPVLYMLALRRGRSIPVRHTCARSRPIRAGGAALIALSSLLYTVGTGAPVFSSSVSKSREKSRPGAMGHSRGGKKSPLLAKVLNKSISLFGIGPNLDSALV